MGNERHLPEGSELQEANQEHVKYIHEAKSERALLTRLAEQSARLTSDALMMSRVLLDGTGDLSGQRALEACILEENVKSVIGTYVALTGCWGAVDKLHWQQSDLWRLWQQEASAAAAARGEPVSTAEPASARGPDGGAEDGT